jgi:2-polyprenyl-3-methyl-5-hydroxy-6-metoxy-1,4-benzoquinol methylase
VGCGSGDLLLALAGAGYRNVSGVDVGSEQVAAARSAGLDVEQADAVPYLESHRESFRAVVACDVMEHMTRDEALAFLTAARRALVADGCLLVRTPNAAAPRGPVYQFGDLTHETAFTPTSLRQLCNYAGAKGVLIRETVPPCNSFSRAVRRVLWLGLRALYLLADIIETGASAEIYSRNLVARVRF